MFLKKRLLGAAALAMAAALLSSALSAQEEAKRPPPLQGFPIGPSGRVTSFTANPSTIQPGQSTTLTWAAVNSDDTSIDQCVGVVPTRGSRQISPTATTTYTFTAAGRGGTDKKSVTVTVTGTTPISPAEGNQGCVAEKDLPIPQMDGHPDLSGVYIGGFGITNRANPTVKPGAESFRIVPKEDDLGQGVLCVPPGVPAATMQPYPLQIVQKPGLVVILYEAYHLFRVIHTDGRPHPSDLDPTWMGNSVGRWEGDTLVIDVTGFNDKTEIAGFHHTTAYHVVERYRRTSYDTLSYEATIDDPNVWTAPWKYGGSLKLHPEWEIQEYVCEENNQNYQDLLNKK
ncbi:MAG: hypothetical protein ABSE45_02910 [Candidatus Acidiferrales bacterium]|jgi:hypothetical protein